MTVRGYALAVDWSGHGNYAETGEDVTGRVQHGDLTITMGRDTNATTGQLAAGELTAGLSNHDRVLSPENTASPLTGLIRPGNRVRFTATAGAYTYNLFEGVLDDYDVADDPARTFSLDALDAWGRPGAEKLSTGLYTGVRTGDAITVVLDAIGWTGGREIDAGATAMSYWWAEGDDAADAVRDLVAAEGFPAVAYVRGGTFVFRDRHHRMFRSRSLTAPATVVSYDFEAGVTDFNGTSGCTFVSSTAQAHTGARSGLLTTVGSPTQAYVRQNATIGVNVGRTYRATMWVYSATATTVTAALDWSTPTGYLGGAYPSFAVAANTWTQLTVSATAPVGATRAAFGPTLISPVAGTVIWLDDVLFEQTDATRGIFTHIEPAGTGPTGDLKVEKDSFVYDHGLKAIANSVSFSTEVRALQVRSEVWSSDEQLSLVAGETRLVQASPSEPFTAAQVSYDLRSGTVSVGLDRTSGGAAAITITATTDAVIDRLALTAMPAPVVRTVKSTTEDATSISTYTRSGWTGDDPPFAGPYDAQAIANRIVAVYATNRPRVTFTVACTYDNTTYLSTLLALDVSDRITVRNDAHDLNTDFIIERIEHRITNLRTHRVTIGAQVADPEQSATAFTFGGLGFNQGSFAAVGIDSPTTVFRFDTAGQGFNSGAFAN